MTERPQDEEHAFRAVLAMFRRRYRVIILATVLVPGLALGLSLASQKEYTATASLLFRDPALDQKLFGTNFVQPARDPTRDAATNVALVSLDLVADRTARALGGKLSGDEISRKMTIASRGQSDVVSVAATDRSPAFATRLANTFAQQYIAIRRDADRSKMEDALHLVQDQLRSLSPAQRAGPEGRALRVRAGQVQILAALQTGNAEIAQPARIPRSPSAPKTTRNVIVGVLFGLIAGFGLAYLLDRLDRRLRDPKEIERIFQRPVLGTIGASRALGQDGPASDGVLRPDDAEAFRMLRANLRYFHVDKPLRSILVTSATTGDGKSTVAWNLARAAAEAGSRVLLIEADLRHPGVSNSGTHLRKAPGLSSVLAGQAQLAEAAQIIVVRAATGDAPVRTLDVLVAGPLPPNPLDLLESERMRSLIREAESEYELVVIDTPPTSAVPDAIPLVNQVSGVTVVARIGKTTREALSQLHRQLENLRAPVLGVVVNGLKLDRFSYGYGYGHGGYGGGPSEDGAEADDGIGGAASDRELVGPREISRES